MLFPKRSLSGRLLVPLGPDRWLSSGANATLEEMKKVYLLFHQFEFRNTRDEDLEDRAKLIGSYASEEEAKLAVGRVKGQPGFRDFPDGFVIDAYDLNQDNWSKGFISWDEASRPPDDTV